MTATDLQARLKSISDSNRSVTQLIDKLSKIVPSYDPDARTPIDTTQERTSLSTEIHETLKELEEDFELLRQEVEDHASTGGPTTRRRGSEKDSQRIAIVAQFDRLSEDLKLSRAHFRRAQLTAKRAQDALTHKQRDLLLGSSSQSPFPRNRRNPQLSQDEQVAAASSDVTLALRRTHQLLTGELSRSEFARETLALTTGQLNELNENYSVLDDLLKNSRGLIGALVTSQKSDTWYLETAFWILVWTIAWLVFRRWFYGPVWWLVYFPLKEVLRLFLVIGNVAVSAVGGRAVSESQGPVSSSRTPLKIQPSASNRPMTRMAGQSAPAIPPGAGGAKGRKEADEGESQSLTEEVGRMAEETQAAEQGEAREQGQEEGTKAGDGTPLRERQPGEKPNPKKRMMEAPPEEKERQRDEL
ncbi:MAG: hypothetical protein MMC23_005792 [Stictis urceolatum]|nr:hypothetical protein [Stictis urceolata]